MAIISQVGCSRLEGARRIDAEYYQPYFLGLMETQDKCGAIKRPLVRLCSKIDVGFVGPMAHAYADNGIPLLQTQNVKEFVLSFDRVIYIQEWFHHFLAKSQVFKGDILIARSGSIGNAALVLDYAPQPLNSSDIIIIRPNSINATYLCAYLNCKFGQAQIKRFSSGGLQGHINLGSLENLQIPILSSNFILLIKKGSCRNFNAINCTKYLYSSRTTFTFRTWLAGLETRPRVDFCAELQSGGTGGKDGRGVLPS